LARLKKMLLWALSLVVLFIILLAALVWAVTFHPDQLQTEAIACPDQTPVLKPGQALKALTYNVQFMAGKNYVFFHDVPNFDGPDDRPSAEDITITLDEVARIIRDENPDVILLQEVDDGSKRTDYEDQLARLMPLLPEEYACHTSAFYMKARFVPHPRVWGALAVKLVIISKYKIAEATRYQLPKMRTDPLTGQFDYGRALFEARFPVEGGQDLVVLNTHLDAFAQGQDTMQQQVNQVDSHLGGLTGAGNPWLVGGDFNLLPPGQFDQLPDDQKFYYNPTTEGSVLYNHYQAVPSLADVNGADYQEWLTYFPNAPGHTGPTQTLDYFFVADNIQITDSYVRQHDTLSISDHMPVVVEFQLPQ
jgi:endonuclease/exonuclease/phosphatase family metal-dependent hydrolase